MYQYQTSSLLVRRSEESLRLSILHIVAPATVGGLESVIHALAIGHRQLGHTVHVAAVIDPGQEDHPFLRPLLDANVGVYPLCIPPRAYMSERQFIRDLCCYLQPDIVHTHGYRPDILDAGIARGLGLPTITTFHGSSPIGGMTRLYEWFQQRVARRFHAVVAVSHPIAERLRRDSVPTDRIHLVPNAVIGNIAFLDRRAARLALGLPTHGYLVGWVGRLVRIKGCDIFLQALAELVDLPLRSAIVGDGIERSALEAQASSLGLSERVKFLGTVQGAARFLSAFDLFVLSSRSEGTPNVLLEAIAAGVPIVAANVGGIPDVISNAEGFLVPPQDPIALAAKIRAVYCDPHGAQERVSAAQRRLAIEFNFHAWLSRYEEIYRRVRHTYKEQHK